MREAFWALGPELDPKLVCLRVTRAILSQWLSRLRENVNELSRIGRLPREERCGTVLCRHLFLALSVWL